MVGHHDDERRDGLIALMEKTGGLDLFTAALARMATPSTITGVIAFVTGLISVYSSTSGVVLPAFLPTIPGLIERLGGGDPLAIAASMNIGAHLVDLSPLSTTGALCIAAIASGENVRSVSTASRVGRARPSSAEYSATSFLAIDHSYVSWVSRHRTHRRRRTRSRSSRITRGRVSA